MPCIRIHHCTYYGQLRRRRRFLAESFQWRSDKNPLPFHQECLLPTSTKAKESVTQQWNASPTSSKEGSPDSGRNLNSQPELPNSRGRKYTLIKGNTTSALRLTACPIHCTPSSRKAGVVYRKIVVRATTPHFSEDLDW